MTKVSDRHLLACMEVLYRAILDARVLAWGGRRLRSRLSGKRDEQIGDLMDAVHNLPQLLLNWEHCDQKLLRDFLVEYDRKWVGHGSSLAGAYDAAVASGKGWVGRVDEHTP